MSDHDEAHPYGFPPEWSCFIETGKDAGYCDIRCFPPPDPSKLPIARLRDYALFQRLLLSLRDFGHASSALAFIRDEIDFGRTYHLAELRKFQCYETTLIVSYCRPFSESTGGLPRLSYGSLGIKLTPFVRALHDDLLDKRNKLFAHSDVASVEFAMPIVLHSEDTAGNPFTTLFPPRFREGMLLDEPKIEQANVLIGCVTSAVMQLLQAMHVNFADRYPTARL